MARLNAWVVRPRENPHATRRLFCFPYAGVGISAFRGWTEHLAPEVEVCLVQPPGREDRYRETPFTSIPELVEVVGSHLTEWLDRPYALYGHSLGAVVAFEAARYLRRKAARAPERLFVGASRAPQLPWPHRHVHPLSDDELIREIDRRYGSIPRGLLDDPEIRKLLLPALRADFQQMETYRYHEAAPLSCGITAFGGASDMLISVDALSAWRHQTCTGFELRILPGSHLFIQMARMELLSSISTVLGGIPTAAAS